MKTVLSIDKKHGTWLSGAYEDFEHKLKKLGVEIELIESTSRIYISLKYSAKSRSVKSAIVSFLCEVYAVKAKREYIIEKLSVCPLSYRERELLAQTLVSFDRIRDFDYIKRSVKLASRFAIDGHYYFKLSELEKRWEEIVCLTNENSDLLYDDGSFNLLLRFLLSTVDPKSEVVKICERGEKFSLEAENEKYFDLDEQSLMLTLVDIAPVEIEFTEKIRNEHLFCKLCEIFDLKNENHDFSYL